MSNPYLTGCCCGEPPPPGCWRLAARCACTPSSLGPAQLAVDCDWLLANYPNGLTFTYTASGFAPFPCYQVSVFHTQVSQVPVGVTVADPAFIQQAGALGQCVACCTQTPCSGGCGGIVSATGFNLYASVAGPPLVFGSQKLPVSTTIELPSGSFGINCFADSAVVDTEVMCGAAGPIESQFRASLSCLPANEIVPQSYGITLRASVASPDCYCQTRVYRRYATTKFGSYEPFTLVGFPPVLTPNAPSSCNGNPSCNLYASACSSSPTIATGNNWPASITLSP